jgi:hypothetical protein
MQGDFLDNMDKMDEDAYTLNVPRLYKKKEVRAEIYLRIRYQAVR